MNTAVKGFIRNLISLSGIQLVTMLIPLIVMPYLIRVAGVDNYGFYSFIVSIMLVAQVFIDFGTTNYGARETALILENNKSPKNFIKSIIKLRVIIYCFFCFSVLLFVFVITTVEFTNLEQKIIAFSLLVPFSYAISCDWYFVGIQKNFVFLKLNFIFKSASLISIFLLIKVPSDIWLAPLIIGGGSVLTSLSAIIYLRYQFLLDTRADTRNLGFIDVINLSYRVFLTKLSIDFYRGINPIAIGSIAGYQYVTYYVVAERVVTALQMLQFPIGRALMPVFTKIFSQTGYLGLLKARKKIMTVAIFVYLMIFIVLVTFSTDIAILLTGELDDRAVLNLRILAVSFLFASFNYLNYMTVIIPSHLDGFFVKRLSYVGLQNLLILFPMVYFFKEAGAATSLLIAEFILTIILVHKIYKINREFKFEIQS